MIQLASVMVKKRRWPLSGKKKLQQLLLDYRLSFFQLHFSRFQQTEEPEQNNFEVRFFFPFIKSNRYLNVNQILLYISLGGLCL